MSGVVGADALDAASAPPLLTADGMARVVERAIVFALANTRLAEPSISRRSVKDRDAQESDSGPAPVARS